MNKKTKQLYYILIYICIKGLLIKLIGHADTFNFLADIMIFYIAYKAPHGKKGELRELLGKGVLFSIGIFLLVGIISDFLNLTAPLTVIWGLRMILRYFLLFYAIIKLERNHDFIDFRKIIYNVFRWNVLVCFTEYLLDRTGDLMGGTFIGNGELSVFLLICLLCFSLDYFVKRISSRNFAIRMAIIFTIAIWAEIKLFYFLIPLSIYTIYVLIKKFSVTHIVILCVAYFSFVPVMEYVLSLYYDKQYVEHVFDYDNIVRETSHAGYNLSAIGRSFNRSTCIKQAEELFLTDPLHYAIGWGIGAGSNSDRFGTWINQKYRDTAYFYFTSSYVLIETGWIGYIAFLLMYLFIVFRFWKIYRNNEKNLVVKYWTVLGLTMSIMTFLFIWYNDRPYADYYLPFCLWAFCFLEIRRSKRISFDNE